MSSGEKLKCLRGKKSRAEIADQAGISVSSYTKYERNERIPRDEVKIRLAAIFGVSVQSLFFEQTVHEPRTAGREQ